MAKKPAKRQRTAPQPVPVHATAARFDGGAVRIELVFQPESAAMLTDQLVNALIRDGRPR